jgi:hypothetical protein
MDIFIFIEKYTNKQKQNKSAEKLMGNHQSAKLRREEAVMEGKFKFKMMCVKMDGEGEGIMHK